MDAAYSLSFRANDRDCIILKYHELITKKELATLIVFVKRLFGPLTKTELHHDDNEVGLRDILANLHKDITVVTTHEEPEALNYVVYVNKKNQLVKISKQKNKSASFAGSDMDEVHEILSFDINTLEESSKHSITSTELAHPPESVTKPKTPTFDYSPGGESTTVEEEKVSPDDDEEDLPCFGVPARKKKPVKDGISQQAFIMNNMKAKPLVENANQTFYTLEDVKKHSKANDCWTVYDGIVYDITSYIKSHPGGKKIMAGAGKD
jgi:cytochrome b involved in lipid metabolism